MALLVDGSSVGTLVAPADAISADLAIEVTDIPVGGGSGSTASPAGSLALGLAGGGLELSLDDASVIYLSTGFVDFVFAGALASIDGQDLPFGLVIGDPVNISFSAQIAPGSIFDNGTYLTAFVAAGTGGVTGVAVPEPMSLLLLLPGLSLLVASRRPLSNRQ
ncbi:MAG: hypothetical protein ABGX16_06795 [Pirellulales bacterium]